MLIFFSWGFFLLQNNSTKELSELNEFGFFIAWEFSSVIANSMYISDDIYRKEMKYEKTKSGWRLFIF